MAGIEEIIVNDQYILVLSVTILSSVIAVVRMWQKGGQISMTKTAFLVVSMIAWFISGAVHMAASPASSPLFPVAYLWYVFGVVFMLFLTVDSLYTWKALVEKKWGDDAY